MDIKELYKWLDETFDTETLYSALGDAIKYNIQEDKAALSKYMLKFYKALIALKELEDKAGITEFNGEVPW